MKVGKERGLYDFGSDKILNGVKRGTKNPPSSHNRSLRHSKWSKKQPGLHLALFQTSHEMYC